MNAITMNGYVRISKQAAQKRWNNNEPFYIESCKMVPGNSWGTTIEWDTWRIKEYIGSGYSFQSAINSFSYYNCDNERGKYPSFYLKA